MGFLLFLIATAIVIAIVAYSDVGERDWDAAEIELRARGLWPDDDADGGAAD